MAKTKTPFFFLIAVALHAGLFFLKFHQEKMEKSSYELGELWVEPVPKEKIRQVVSTSRSDEESDEPAKYAGEFRNRTKRQTKARRSGNFRESTPEIQGGVDGRGIARFMPGAAFSPDELEGVEEGSETVLNTDAVSYAAFMNRIKERVYDNWDARLQEVARKRRLAKQKTKAGDYSTNLKVIFNEEGYIVAIRVIESSGDRDFDDALKHAIWEKEPFRNPPETEEGIFPLNIGATYTVRNERIQVQRVYRF